MVNNNFVKLFFSVFLLALIPTFACAVVITLEPDDYGMGVPLENEYVKVTSSYGSPYDTPWHEKSAITAKHASESGTNYKAPTGEYTFGNILFVPRPHYGDLDAGGGGLILLFNQAVSRVTMLANSGAPEQWFNAASWVAFNRTGELIAQGSDGVPEGFGHETFEIDIQHEDIWTVIMGGAETTQYIYFDHLTFELPDASVPAPNPLILFAIGLAMIMLPARSKR